MGHRADAFAARSIKRATSFGLEIYAAWLAGTSIISLPACLAMLRSRSGLMLWSWVAISAQLFFWCQAAAVTGAPPAALANIIWEWAMKSAWTGGTSAAKSAGKAVGSRYRKSSLV